MGRRTLTTFATFIALIIGMAVALGGAPAAHAQGGTSTLTVDLSGSWYKDITVQLWSADGSAQIWSKGNQHGGLRTYSVDAGSYLLKLVEGNQSWQQVVDCSSATCAPTDFRHTLSVDLSGSWYKDITVQLNMPNGGEKIWAVGNQHGAVRQYNVLAGSYDVLLTQGDQVNTIANVDCTADCAPAVPRHTLTVDLSGSWYKDITVQLNKAGGAKLWAVGNQHGATRSYNVLAGSYDIVLAQGGQSNTIANVDCTADCTAVVPRHTLTVDLSGSWYKDITVQLNMPNGGEKIWAQGNQHGAARQYNVLAGSYDIVLAQGGQSNTIANVDCTADCTAVVPRHTLTVDLSGSWYKDITVGLSLPNGGGAIWAVGNQHGAARQYNVLAGSYDVLLTQGPQGYAVNAIDCTSDDCSAGDVTAQLSIDLSGSWGTGIGVRLSQDDASAGSAGSEIWSISNQHGAVRTYNVLKAIYDVAAVKGGKDYLWDAVDCRGETCTPGASTLTVQFTGISSAHAYLYKSDGKPGQLSGQLVGQQTYKNNQANFPGLASGLYDVKVVKGAAAKIIDNVAVLGSSPVLDDITANLVVNFDGISSVHTYLKTSDGSGAVDERTYKTDKAEFVVLKAPYQVVVVKGAQQNSYSVDASNGDVALSGITATLTVDFTGIASVHTYLKTSGGGAVDERTYKTDKAEFVVLKAPYQVVVVKGAQQNSYSVDTSNGDYTLSGITANLKVDFTGISSVHTYLKTSGGGAVDERTYKTDQANFVVLKAPYQVVVVKGAQQNSYSVDASNGDVTLSGITATLTVYFPGISSVHTYVRTSDGGGAVDERTYKTDQAQLAVLRANYQVTVVKGAQRSTYAVDCSAGASCDLGGIVSSFTLNFPNKGSVHVYLKLDDQAAGQATGGDVDSRTYQSNQTTMSALKGSYDVVVKIGSETYTLDAVDLSADSVEKTLTVIKLLSSGGAGIADGAASYYASGWKALGSTPDSGVLALALPGKPGSYPFAMSYLGGRQQLTQNLKDNIVVLFQTAGVTVRLLDSNQQPLADGAASYYASGWKPFGTTSSNGTATMDLLPGSYPFAISYLGGRQQLTQNIASDPVVTFQTVDVTVRLLGSSQQPLAGGEASYYASGWKAIASTASDGTVHQQLLPGSYPFAISYLGGRQQLTRNIASDPVVTFQTVDVTVRLLDSSQQPLAGGAASYYASGWKAIASTASDGTVHQQLLPGSYPFAISYLGGRQQLTQNIASAPVVTFQTAVVTSDSGKANGYYASGWKAFVSGMELLPGSYTFRFDGMPNKPYSISAGVENHIQ